MNKNSKRGLSSFESLLGILDLEDRVIDIEALTDFDKITSAIEWHTRDALLSVERERSVRFLEKALS